MKPGIYNKRYGQMDAEKPFKGIFFLSCPEIAKEEIQHKGDKAYCGYSHQGRRNIHSEK